MEIDESRLGSQIVLRPIGRVDNLTSDEFQTRLIQVAVHGTADVIVDLTAVPYIASGGLRALMAAARQMPADRRLAVAGLNQVVQDIFTIGGFHQVIPVFATVEEARQAWR